MSTPDDQDSAALFPDYVAECEEHLTSAGRLLLDIEAAPGRFDRSQLDSLFRSFHSIKGLSGMVGLQEAERLSHHLENYLGAVRKGRVDFGPEGVALLVESLKSLEQVISAGVSGQPIPAVDALTERVVSLLPVDKTETSSFVAAESKLASEPAADPYSRANAAVREGANVWCVRFAPSQERTARGLTVNTVRERLRAAGEIVHAAPVVSSGGVTFTFLVVSRTAEFPAAAPEDGLTVEPYESPPTVPSEIAPPSDARITSLTPANLVRVDLGRLDDLMRTVGELVITRARLENGLSRVNTSLPATELRELRETSLAMERQLRDLRE
jgi:two-component system chemotaxis sensor kinase CheA